MQVKLKKTLYKFCIFLDNIYLPVLDISLWGLLRIYVGGIFRNQVIKQASSISWSFFLSLFPFILFLLSVLPYLPHYDELYHYIFKVAMPRLLPAHMKSDVIGYIESDIIPNIKRISNFTVLLAVIFATNGTYSLINGFDENTEHQRGLVQEYVLAFFITLGFTAVILASLFGVYYAEIVVRLLMPEQYELNWIFSHLTKIIGLVSFPLFYFLSLALLYRVGATGIRQMNQAVPGAVFTTVLFMLTTYVFAIYIKNFARYNVLYGSIGSMILLMIWVNVNVVLVLLGNELNLAIAKIHSDNREKKSLENTK